MRVPGRVCQPLVSGRKLAAGVLMCLMLCSACTAIGPRFTNRPVEEPPSGEPVVQREDLAGELLVTPPQQRGEQVIVENPDAVLTLAGLGEQPTIVVPDTLPPVPDTTIVVQRIPQRGPRKEYQVQVAITPSADEAEDFKERLGPLLPGEEVFVIFTSPYYRIRVGRKAKREDADQLLTKLYELGYTGAMVIPVTITPGGGAY